MRRHQRNNSSIVIPILAIVAYILLLGFIWGTYILVYCLFIDYENFLAAYFGVVLGYLSGSVGIFLTIFVFIKNRFFGCLVLGFGLFFNGIALIVLGAISENRNRMIIAIILGIVFIASAAGSFVMAFTERINLTSEGGLDLGHVEHRGVVFDTQAGVNIQTNRGPTIANI